MLRSPTPALPLSRSLPAQRRSAPLQPRPAGPLDDSPRVLAQRRQLQALFGPPAAVPTQPALQRRVAVAQKDKNDENDWVILTNLQYAKGLVGGDVSDFATNSDYSGMGKSESLAVVGHGSAGEIQGFNADSIAAAITQQDKAMPKTVPYVILLSCNAAKPTKAQDPSSSLVSRLAFILRRDKGYDTIVEGKPSYTQVSPTTGVNATLPTKETKHMDVEKPLIAKHKLSFTSPPKGLSAERKAWFLKDGFDVDQGNNLQIACAWLAKHQILKLVSEIMEEEQVHNWQAMDLEARAAWVAVRTAGLYQDLAREAASAGTLFKPGRGPKSGTTLAYGGATLEI